MPHHKAQSPLTSLNNKNAILIARRINAELFTIGLKHIHLLAEGVEDTHRTKAFALQGQAFIGRVGEERNGMGVLLQAYAIALVLLIALAIHGEGAQCR